MTSNDDTSHTQTRHKVAAVQIASVAYDLVATLNKVQSWAEEAAQAGAELVVFPEALVSAYPRKLGFQIGARSPEDREWYKRYLQSSVRVPPLETRDEVVSGPVQKETDEYYGFQRLARLARAIGVYLSIGVIERSLEGATTWCTNLIFSPKGELISRHRKFQPTAAERVVWSQGEKLIDGKEDNLPVVKTGLGKVGGLICWENYMPLARYALYRRDIEIYLAPTADARDTWLPTMQHIAQEGRVFVVSANQYHTSRDFPVDYPARVALEGEPGEPGACSDGPKADAETWSRGGSCIVGPLGAVLAGPLWDKEGILYADIDTDELLGAKLDFDVAGHYSRHDLMLSLLDA